MLPYGVAAFDMAIMEAGERAEAQADQELGKIGQEDKGFGIGTVIMWLREVARR